MTTPPPADLMIGKYHILELAGEGAMGAVYRARDTVLNRFVAIKVMNATIARDSDLRDRFLREAQAAGSLQHPNVVTVFDFGEVDGHLFIAMEFVEGTDLEHLLSQPEPPTLEVKLEIMIDALAGLAYAHQHGIVHRDLKPANIRVTTESRGKLMDFGVAHVESSKMTQTGTMIGTPSYMAPEYISGKPVTSVSDVFSMGAVLYHLLTGVKPFDGESLHAVLFSVVQNDPPLPSSLVPSLPSALDGIVRRAMAKDPADRFQSALDMANALTALRAQMRGLPGNVTQSLSTTLAHRVASRGAAAARDVAVRTGASSAHVASSPSGKPAPDVQVATPPSKSRASLMIGGGVAVVALITAAVVVFRQRPVVDARTLGESVAAAPTVDPGATSATATTPSSPASGTAVSASNAPSIASSTIGAKMNASKTTPVGARTDSVGAAVSRPPETKGLTAAASNQAPAVSASQTVAPTAAQTAAPTAAPTLPPAPVISSPVVSEPAAARNVPNELRDVIVRYGQAISSRDIAAIRALYPRITSDQQRGFERFFASTKSLEATLSLGSIQVTDATAEGRVSGVYAFTTSSGSSQRQAVNFRATFEREGDKWRLSSVQ